MSESGYGTVVVGVDVDVDVVCVGTKFEMKKEESQKKRPNNRTEEWSICVVFVL